MGTVFDFPALHLVHQHPQLRRVAGPAALDGGLAGHGVEQALPPLRRGAAGAELLRELLQGGHRVLGVDVRRDLPHQDSTVAEILAGEAELLQKGQVLQQEGTVLPAQLRRDGLEQRLAHGGLQGRLEAVEVHPLMGGVLVDEPDAAVLALADDVGVKHLSGDAPGGLLGRLDGLLDRQVQRLLSGNGRHKGPLGGLRLYKGCCLWDRLRFLHRRRPGRHRGRRGGQGTAGRLFPRLIGKGLRLPVRHLGRGPPLRVPGGPGRLDRLGLGSRGGGLLPEGFGIHGLEEVLPGIHRFRRGLRLRLGDAVRRQAVQHRVVHGVEHLPLPGELHRGLGGMDVDIHRRHRQCHGEDTAGELALHDLVAVALLQGRCQQLGLDEPAVDEEYLHGPGPPAHEGLGDEAGHLHLTAPALHRSQAPGEVPAQGGIDGGLQLPVAGGVEGFGAVLDEFERNIRMGQGQMLHESRHGGGLGAVLLHEFQPGGGVVKQVPDDDGGPLRCAGLLHGAGHAPLQVQRGAGSGPLLPGQNIGAADGGDGRQSLTPEAQGADPAQVLGGAQLAGGVAEERGGQLLRGDAAAVVRHPDEAHAAPLELHRHGGAMGVDGIFHQFLHHAGRPFDDLTGGDEVRHVGI